MAIPAPDSNNETPSDQHDHIQDYLNLEEYTQQGTDQILLHFFLNRNVEDHQVSELNVQDMLLDLSASIPCLCEAFFESTKTLQALSFNDHHITLPAWAIHRDDMDLMKHEGLPYSAFNSFSRFEVTSVFQRIWEKHIEFENMYAYRLTTIDLQFASQIEDGTEPSKVLLKESISFLEYYDLENSETIHLLLSLPDNIKVILEKTDNTVAMFISKILHSLPLQSELLN